MYAEQLQTEPKPQGAGRLLSALRACALWVVVLLPLGVALTLMPTAFPGWEHDGRVSGELLLGISSLLAIYGLGLGLSGLRWRPLVWPARVVLLAALTWYTHAAIAGNSRWAATEWRFAGHLAVLGSIWIAEGLQILRSRADGATGALSLGAAMALYYSIWWELRLVLSDSWRRPLGEMVPLVAIQGQEAQVALWTAGLWLVWSALVYLVGRRYKEACWTALTGALAACLWATWVLIH